jgi:hypothetical protein
LRETKWRSRRREIPSPERLDKFEEFVERCEHLILQGKLSEAIDALKETLQSSSKLIEICPFQRLGNVHNWFNEYPPMVQVCERKRIILRQSF